MSRYAGPLTGFTLFALLALPGCDSPAPTASDPTRSTPPPGATIALDNKGFRPPVDKNSFVSTITNPYLPGIPGTTFTYRSVTPDGIEINTVEYTGQTTQIMGVAVQIIHDQVFLNGELSENTFDWEAQDGQGNVWYFGEDTKVLENGQVVSTEGSWRAGVNGALPGVIMLAQPKTGKTYVQEDAPDVAEDRGKALSLKAKVTVPYGSFTGCLETLEWSLLELGVRDHKFYCPGVGFVKEVSPKGGPITSELISIAHN
jgi:hypothetical protein